MDPPSDAAVHFQGQETSIMTLWERVRRNKYNAVVRGRQQAYDEIVSILLFAHNLKGCGDHRWIVQIAIPSEVLDQVSLPRDQCIFTGATSDPSAGQDVVLSWFFPPYLRGEVCRLSCQLCSNDLDVDCFRSPHTRRHERSLLATSLGVVTSTWYPCVLTCTSCGSKTLSASTFPYVQIPVRHTICALMQKLGDRMGIAFASSQRTHSTLVFPNA